MGVGLCEFESHHPHEKGSYLNDRWLPFFVLGPQTRTRTAPEGLSGERLTGGSHGQQDTGAPVFESHHPHEKGSYLNDR